MSEPKMKHEVPSFREYPSFGGTNIATSLEDIGDVTVTIQLPRPDGQTIGVQLRALSEGEIWKLRRAVKYPKPPVKDFKKIGGEVVTEYDYLNEEYLDGRIAADRDLMRRMMVASLMLVIPGSTIEEQCAALEMKLGQWAFNILVDAVNKINIPSQEAIDSALLSFQPVSTAGASGHGHAGDSAA